MAEAGGLHLAQLVELGLWDRAVVMPGAPVDLRRKITQVDEVADFAFFPRQASAAKGKGMSSFVDQRRTTTSVVNNAGGVKVADGEVSVDPSKLITIGYRFYRHPKPDAPLICYFHGNGEIASEYDSLAHEFLNLPASLLIFEYRGYGWSSPANAAPLFSSLLSDAEKCFSAIPRIFADGPGVTDTPPLILFGRSMGSLLAIHLAHRFSGKVIGLVIESGMSAMRRWVPIS